MRAALKSIVAKTPFYPAAKEIYRRTINRGYLRGRQQLMQFYSGLVREGGLVFDVGANRGDFTDAFLRLGCRVCAIEPHPVCIAELSALYGRRPGFRLVAAGLGAKEGSADLFLGECGMDNVSTMSEDYRREAKKLPGLARAGWNESVSVRLETLDRLIDLYGSPDFCKIDVEGYEIHVLRGLTHPLPLMQFEYQPWSTESAVECLDYLARLGPYRFNITMSAGRDDKVALQATWQSAEEMAQLLRQTVATTHCVGDVFASLGQS